MKYEYILDSTQAYEPGVTDYSFWCIHWQTNHFHGIPDPDPSKLVHRAAHCTNAHSPYLKRGYWLRIV
jgi:hypothetical protein